jgi:hypothetical protein
VLSASAESMPKISARQENTKVTIYHGTDCKLYEFGARREAVRAPKP